MRKHHFLKRFALISLLFLLIISCTTTPPSVPSQNQDLQIPADTEQSIKDPTENPIVSESNYNNLKSEDLEKPVTENIQKKALEEVIPAESKKNPLPASVIKLTTADTTKAVSTSVESKSEPAKSNIPAAETQNKTENKNPSVVPEKTASQVQAAEQKQGKEQKSKTQSGTTDITTPQTKTPVQNRNSAAPAKTTIPAVQEKAVTVKTEQPVQIKTPAVQSSTVSEVPVSSAQKPAATSQETKTVAIKTATTTKAVEEKTAINPAQQVTIEILSPAKNDTQETQNTPVIITETKKEPPENIKLLFTGDLMAHSVNYQISDYAKIYRDIKYLLDDADITFTNLEAPVDTTKSASSYPNFNMTKKYVDAAVDAGFDVFSLCNNHTNDQGLDGIKQTIITSKKIMEENLLKGKSVYFSGLKEKTTDSYSYNIIEKKGWKILFLPMTEILNRGDYSKYINYVNTTAAEREKFVQYVKKLRQENPCDLFILSLHANETEYIRTVTAAQKNYYQQLLDAGVDILWCNHAHIIKDRQFIFDAATGSQKLIMYANGNVISGQRTKPDFGSSYPDQERDNTGDGLFYYVTLQKRSENLNSETGAPFYPPLIVEAKPVFITTYINTAWEFVLKPLNQEFIDYLKEVPRNNWAEYVKKRILINESKTKDLITWQ